MVPAHGLDIALSRQIMVFHSARRIRPRFGRTIFKDGANYHRWCFADRETALAFQEQFGGKICSSLK
jgi:hypothetical protein